jgi:uncharacterized repeat protein (TIGR01451 family)
MVRKPARWLLLALAIAGAAALCSQPTAAVHAQDGSQPDTWSLQILEADARHVLLELTLSATVSETVVHDGTTYQRWRVADWPNWGQPGQPQLPMHAVPLGMPAPGVPQVAVIAAESQTVAGVLAYPAPALALEGEDVSPQVVETFAFDAGTYRVDDFVPGPMAEAASVGWLRDQPMFQLRLYPFQYNPQQRELRIYRRLRVLVTFPTDDLTSTGASRPEPVPAFEQVLEQTLLNYSTLPRPVPQPTRPPVVLLDTLEASPQVKLRVEQPGLYRVTYNNVLAIAPDLVQADPRNLELSNRGSSIPIDFEGEADGTFDPGDSFLFYGQAIESNYTRYNVYWLSDAGTPGLRVAQRDGTPGTGSTPTAFSDSRYYEKDALYWQSVPGGVDQDHWFWEKLAANTSTPASTEYDFELRHTTPSGPDGELRLMLHGATSGDHLTQLTLNGVALLSPVEQSWSGQEAKLYTVPVSQTLFVEGMNHLKVESTLPAGEQVSQVYVNWFEVTYQDTFVAEADYLRFSTPSAGSWTYVLTGFSTSSIGLFDVTDPNAPVRITGYAVEPDGAGYRLRFDDAATAAHQYVAQRTDEPPAPSLLLDEPSAWKSPTNGATYVIITHPSFSGPLQTLATHRTSQGETVITVKTDDVYDEFYHGIYDPRAIRSFLEYAYANWSPRPTYVLLVGDASLDPKNNRGSSYPDLLPAYYVDTPLFGQAPNDTWYAKVHGDDDYPDLIVGRIPARWGTDIDIVTAKILAYENAPPPGEWFRRAVLTADDDSPAFPQNMETLAGLLPAGFTPTKLYSYNPNTSVCQEISAGTLLVAYSGHGNSHAWGKWNNSYQIFEQGQMSSLQNGNKLPFVAMGNCLNGFFVEYSNAHCLAEDFLMANNRGAIASWAPASYGFVTTNGLLLEELYQALFSEGDLTLGSAATAAKVQASSRRPDQPLSVFEVFTYFGDPAVQLNAPATLELGGQDDPDPVTLGEPLTYTLAYTVSGAARARGLTLVDTLPSALVYQSASPPPSSIYARTLTWNLGDTPAGTYTVTVTALVGTTGLAHGQEIQNQARLYDAIGGDQTVQIETTLHDAPIVGLSASNDSSTELGNPTALSAGVASGTNVVYTWDFGDGAPSQSGTPVQHTYPAIGTYIAQITAANGVSSLATTTVVTITDVPPAASFTSSSPDMIGQTTTFQSTSAGTNLIYRWDFGDETPPTSGELPSITHTYAHTDTFTVTLTISNTVGTSTATGMIRILPHVDPPVASFTSSSPGEIGQTTYFVNTSEDGGDDEENLTYSWNFGDGTSSTARHPAHTYAGLGTYTVRLTISNSFYSDTCQDTVLITDVPITGLAISNDSPTALGHATALAATTVSGTNISYRWALGDGTFSTLKNPVHTYPATGHYTVVLTATNGRGSLVATDVVAIVDEPIEGLTISHDSPTTLGNPTSFAALASAGTNVTYMWDLGDGTISTLWNPVHTYAAVGDYTVILTTTNSLGKLVRTTTVPLRWERRPHSRPPSPLGPTSSTTGSSATATRRQALI